MGGIRTLLAVLLVSVILLSSSSATANEVRIGMSPSTVAPGDAVTVLSTCGGGSVASEVFDETDLVSLSRDDRFTSGATSTVDGDAPSGVYDVEVTCHDGRFGIEELVVTDTGAHTGDGAMAGGVDGATTGVGALLLIAAGLGLSVLVRRRRATS